MSMSEIADLQRAIGQVRQCVGALRKTYGDAAAVRRLVNDVERLDIDVDEFAEGVPTTPAPRPPEQRDIVVVPDTPYDPNLWLGADDEGVGGYRGRHS